jgi:hypothetical protein
MRSFLLRGNDSPQFRGPESFDADETCVMQIVPLPRNCSSQSSPLFFEKDGTDR